MKSVSLTASIEDIRALRDLGVDRHKVIGLSPSYCTARPREVDEGLHVRTRGRSSGQEIAHRGPDRLFIQVACADDVETCRLQHLRHEIPASLADVAKVLAV